MGMPAKQSKPLPLFSGPTRPKCPVCGQSVYSKAGIHPQCAQTQADERWGAKLKEKEKRAAQQAVPDDEVLSSWHKRCPKCKQKLHVRKGVCDCGYKFPSKPKASP